MMSPLVLILGSGKRKTPVFGFTSTFGPRRVCCPFVPTSYASEQWPPRCCMLGGGLHTAQSLSEAAAKPCLSQACPICSKRPSFNRNMFSPITGCSAFPPNQLSQQDPMLHAVVAIL